MAYLFAGKSGVGKSTHARLWKEHLGGRACIVNDDKPLINAETCTVYGTPWSGKSNLDTNIAKPLKAICFIEQAKENSIEKLCTKDCVVDVLGQTYRQRDAESAKKTLELVDKMLRQISIYKLKCNTDISSAIMSYNTMTEVL